MGDLTHGLCDTSNGAPLGSDDEFRPVVSRTIHSTRDRMGTHSSTATPSEQVTYTYLIGQSRGLDPEMTQHLHNLIDQQLRGDSIITYGFDLLSA